MTTVPFLAGVFPSAEGAFAGKSERVDAELDVDEAAGTFLGCPFAAGSFAVGAFAAAAFLTAVALMAFAEAVFLALEAFAAGAFFSTREPT